MKLDRFVPLLAFALITSALIVIPAERTRDASDVLSFFVTFLTAVAIFALITLGLNIHWGYTGILNFGVAAFFLVGAFTAAVFTKDRPAEGDLSTYVAGFGERLDFIPGIGSDQWLPFLIAILAAATFSGLLALFLSLPALRLRQDYLAIATIGVAELVRRVAIEERGLVNGTRGLPAIPAPLEAGIPTPWGQVLTEPNEYKFIILGFAVFVLVVTFVLVERVVRSPWGRVLRAIREDELTTTASGKNVFAFKAQAFVLGAMVMGVGGAIFSFQRGAIAPQNFDHFFGTFLLWAMLIVGGSGSSRGAIFGAYIVWGFWRTTILLQTYDLPALIETRIFFIRDFAIGALIVLALLLRPRGLLPEERRVSLWLERLTLRGPPRDEPEAPGEQPA